jgi:dTDP-4-amino-4,6-dideoxygalactose transaminase
LRSSFASCADIILPKVQTGLYAVPFCFPLLLQRHDRDRVMCDLEAAGIETRPLFSPQYQQPYWSSLVSEPSPDLPVAEHLSKSGLYLSTSPHLSLGDCDYIASVLIDILAGKRVFAAGAHA